MQIARVNGLTQDLYTEVSLLMLQVSFSAGRVSLMFSVCQVVLPELLWLIPACEDAAGQVELHEIS